MTATPADAPHVVLIEVSGSALTLLARRLASVVAVFGSAVLFLWLAAPGVIADLPWAGLPTKPVTAVCLVLLGMTLARPGTGHLLRRAMTVTLLLLGCEGILSIALDRPLLTASLLFPQAWEAATPDRSGGMALGTAIALVCIAAALLSGPRLRTTLCAAGFALGYVAVLGHLYGVSDLYSLQTASQMALPTALALLVAAGATAIADADLPLPKMLTAPGTAGVLVRRVLPWAVLGPPVVGRAILSGEQVGGYNDVFSLSLVVAACVFGTATATILGARTAARTDAARERAADQLAELNGVLAERVAVAVASAESDRDELGILLDATPAGIFEVDPAGGLRYVNQRWRELAGLTAEQAAAEKWSEAVHPADRDRVVALWSECLRTGADYQVRYRYLRPDGSVVWVDTTARGILDQRGEVDRWLGSVVDVTDEVASAQQLSESEIRYRSVVATMAEGVVLMDADGRIVTVNEAACRVLGLSTEELMSPESGDFRWNSLQEDGSQLPREEHPAAVAMRTGRPVRDVTMGVPRTDGSVVWLMVSAEPMVGADGRDAAGVVTTFTDVTATRAAAAALRRSEEQFRHAMALAPIGMALVELDGRFREVNQSLARLVGYGETELMGLTFQQITHPEDLEADLDNIAALLDGSLDHYDMEKRYLTKAGEIVWVHLAVSMATDDRDRPAYFIAQIQDITDSRAAKEQLTHRALHDPLTGLPNRDLLMDHLSHTLARSARAGTMAAVMFCDLDDFKSVNDTHGHEAGDLLLVSVADRLRGVMRPGDTVARLGGDEFVVVAEGLPDAGAVRALAERVRRALAAPVQIAGHAVRARASIGVVIATAEDDSRSVLREADAAMYRAKALGRDRLELGAGLEPPAPHLQPVRPRPAAEEPHLRRA